METATNKTEFLKLNKKSGEVKAGVFYTDFTDNGHIVRYIPSLKLSCYGENPKEVEEMMNVVLDDFFEHLMELSELAVFETLEQLGWKRNKFFKKQFTGSSYVDREGVLRDLELPESTILDSKFLEVA